MFSEEDYKKYKETVFNGLPSIGGINYVYKNDSISKKKHKNFIRDIEESIDPFFTSHQLTSTIIAKFINSLLDEVGICCHSIIPSGSIARRTCITKNKHTIDYDYLVELDTFDDDNILQACNLFAEKTSAKILEGNRPSQWHLGEVQFHDKIIDVDVTFILKLPNNIVITHMAKQLQYTNILKNHGESVLKSILANIIAAKSIFKNALTSKASNVVGLGGIGIETWIVQSGGSMLNAFIDFKTIFSQNLYDIPPEVYNSELLLFNDPGVAHKKDLMNDNYLVSLFSNQKDKSIQHMISIVDSYLEQI
ncbi:hypothetical protein [Desulfobacula toluolica]|uniref:hypothetical protein n=1 Tax=Desulfobacula toluolica TaxID=28223 RepID=UPI0011D294BD|nr:hypothetical protein [Desulfobacula toluolica]